MRMKSIAAVSLTALMASGCVSAPGPFAVRSAEEAPLRADVNPGYKAGSVKIPTKPTKSLSDIINGGVPAPKKETKAKDDEDKLRLPAMQDAALAYGARAGLAWSTREINRTLEANSSELTKTYDFQSLMIQGPNGVMVVPPVISEARDTWEAFDAGKTLRVADTVYEIIKQSTFTSVAPMWQAYLIGDFKEPEMPPEALAPKDESEVERWRGWVQEGWKKGEQQAKEIFESNQARLNRDFTGMVRYRQLLEEGKVAAPVLAEGNMGVTGTGQDMRVNDRAIRITRDPTLVVQPNGWGASATTTDAAGKPVGPENPVAEPAPEAPSKPKPKGGSAWGKPVVDGESPKAAPKRPRATAPAKTATAEDKPVDKATSGGAGRF